MCLSEILPLARCQSLQASVIKFCLCGLGRGIHILKNKLIQRIYSNNKNKIWNSLPNVQ